MSALLAQVFSSPENPQKSLLGTLHQPKGMAQKVGIVFITGGYQIRAGAHRQAFRLAQKFATAGYACFRFDLPGLGDSLGEVRGFHDNEAAIRAAIDTFFQARPDLNSVALWGLCDGASAATLYAPSDSRVKGLFLINPWVYIPQLAAETLITSYYSQRLLSADFWQKLLSGRVEIGRSVAGYARTLWQAKRAISTSSVPETMRSVLSSFAGVLQIVISEKDLTGQAFLRAFADLTLPVLTIEGAEHTLADNTHHLQLQAACLQWLIRLSLDAKPD